LPSSSRATAVAASESPPSQPHRGRGRNVKAKATPRNSGASENARARKATPRRVSRAMSPGPSDDETSDHDLVAQGLRGEYVSTCPILYFATYTFSFSSLRARSAKNQKHLACRRTAESQRTSCKALSCSELAPTSVGWCKIWLSSTR
jgi:hypothetical protein